MSERHAIQALHDEERLTFILADFVDRADIGMIERGSCTSFASQSL